MYHVYQIIRENTPNLQIMHKVLKKCQNTALLAVHYAVKYLVVVLNCHFHDSFIEKLTGRPKSVFSKQGCMTVTQTQSESLQSKTRGRFGLHRHILNKGVVLFMT